MSVNNGPTDNPDQSDQLEMSDFSSYSEEDVALDDVDSDILLEDHLEDEHLGNKSPELQQRPDCPGLNMSVKNGPTDNPDQSDQLEIRPSQSKHCSTNLKKRRRPSCPEQQQRPDSPGLSKQVSRKRKTSSGSRCASIKSEASPGCIKAKKRRSGTSDSDESNTSSVSFKSDRSRDELINFKAQPPPSRVSNELEELHLKIKSLFDDHLGDVHLKNKRLKNENEGLCLENKRLMNENEKLCLENKRLNNELEELWLKLKSIGEFEGSWLDQRRRRSPYSIGNELGELSLYSESIGNELGELQLNLMGFGDHSHDKDINS